MSSPESVSSSTASLGSSTAICRISLRFFSPPEKPAFTERCIIAGSMSSIGSFCSMYSRNSIGSISDSPRAFRISLNAVRRKYAFDTPGISTGYWNARKTPACARASGAMREQILPHVGHAAAGHFVTRMAGDHLRQTSILPEPFGPMIAWTSPAFTCSVMPFRISRSPALAERSLISSTECLF